MCPHSARHDLNDISTLLVPSVIRVLMNHTSTVVELGSSIEFHCGGNDIWKDPMIRKDPRNFSTFWCIYIHFTSVNQSASHYTSGDNTGRTEARALVFVVSRAFANGGEVLGEN